MFVGGCRLDRKKRICDSLRKIYGIGYNKGKQIVCLLGLTNDICLKEIDYWQQIMLDKIIVHYIHGYRAMREKHDKIIFLQENRSYRGVRHSYFLSVRGQRTRTNAKTQRNKKNKKIKIKKINKLN